MTVTPEFMELWARLRLSPQSGMDFGQSGFKYTAPLNENVQQAAPVVIAKIAPSAPGYCVNSRLRRFAKLLPGNYTRALAL